MSPQLQLLCLILAANGSPIVMRLMVNSRLSRPIDGGHLFIDQRPLFGPSKTWAGLIVAVAVTGLLAAAMGLSASLGLLVGLTAMTGDLLSSFVKRRLGMPSSSPAPILDQLPESLFPALLAAAPMGLSARDILLTVSLFFALEIALSHLLYRCGRRKYPY